MDVVLQSLDGRRYRLNSTSITAVSEHTSVECYFVNWHINLYIVRITMKTGLVFISHWLERKKNKGNISVQKLHCSTSQFGPIKTKKILRCRYNCRQFSVNKFSLGHKQRRLHVSFQSAESYLHWDTLPPLELIHLQRFFEYRKINVDCHVSWPTLALFYTTHNSFGSVLFISVQKIAVFWVCLGFFFFTWGWRGILGKDFLWKIKISFGGEKSWLRFEKV